MAKSIEILSWEHRGGNVEAQVICHDKKWYKRTRSFKTSIVLHTVPVRFFKRDFTLDSHYWAHSGIELDDDWYKAFEDAQKVWIEKHRANPGRIEYLYPGHNV